jgi:hypothetical protein
MAAERGMGRNYSTLLLQTVRCGQKRTQVALRGQQKCSVHESYCSVQPHTLHRVDFSHKHCTGWNSTTRTAQGGLQLPSVCV